MNNNEIEEYLVRLDNEVIQIKEDIYRISWHMRGGVKAEDLFHKYSNDDIEILNAIIAEHVKLTKETQMPLL